MIFLNSANLVNHDKIQKMVSRGITYPVVDTYLAAVIESTFLKENGGQKSFLWGHCFGLLVTSPLCFKARMGSFTCTWWRRTRKTFPEIRPGRTPADLLVVSMATEPYNFYYLWVGMYYRELH